MRRRSVSPVFWLMAQLGSRVRVDPPKGLDLTSVVLPALETRMAPTRHGPVRSLVQRPASTDPSSPVVLHLHGGGFVNRYPEQDRHVARYLAARLGTTVVLADYATAPRVRYPVAEEQVLDVARWLQRSGSGPGWDGDRLLVSGVSAGAKLAINVCQQLHTLGARRPLAAALIVPVTDFTRSGRTSPIARPAISPRVMRFVEWAYLPDPVCRGDALASPGLDPALPAAMPPTLVQTAEHDTLAGEGAELVERLQGAGVTAELHQLAGVDHGFLSSRPVGPVRAALERTVSFFGTHFTRSADETT